MISEVNKKPNNFMQTIFIFLRNLFSILFFGREYIAKHHLLNEVQLAVHLRLSVQAVFSLIEEGMPVALKGTGHYLFDYAEVLSWYHSRIKTLEDFSPETIRFAFTQSEEVKNINVQLCEKVFQNLKPNAVWEISLPDDFTEGKKIVEMLNQVGFTVKAVFEIGGSIEARKVI